MYCMTAARSRLFMLPRRLDRKTLDYDGPRILLTLLTDMPQDAIRRQNFYAWQKKPVASS